MKKIISIVLSVMLVLNICFTLGGVSVSAETYTSGDYEYIVSDDTATITQYNGAESDVTVPYIIGGYSVTNIGEKAFYDCTSLTKVTIPNSVTSIGDYAFYDCTNLISVTIPSSVTIIGDCAFCRCSGLTGVSIPDSVTIIEDCTFWGCSGLTSITIPNSVTNIGAGAFINCTGLTSITIPDSVTSIGKNAFYTCTSLNSVTIGNSVTSIGESAFYDCTGITNIMVAPQNKVFDSRNNCNAIIETETNQLIVGCSATIIPDSITSIGDGAFSGRNRLTSITIPNSVASIGDGAFSACRSLTSITIPNGVTNIGKSAFDRCTSLKRIIISNSVRSIGNHAFYGCSSLTSITIPDSVTSIGNGAFYGCTKLYGAVVPMDYIDLNINNIFPSTTEIYYREKEFTVNYDANGGSDAPEQLLFTSDTKTIPFTVTKQIPSRTGYIFEGWSNEQNGSADYLPGKTYIISNSITLYAVWRERNTYTIKYELCGGEGNISSQIKTEGIGLILNSIKPTHAKYTFAYWISSNKQTTYSAGSTYEIDANDTLYAVWKEVCSGCNGTRYSKITTCQKCCGDGKITYSTVCDSCNGTGKKTKTHTETCSNCEGLGAYYGYGFDFNGNFGWGILPCPYCDATGTIKVKEQVTCTKCGGDGKASSETRCTNCDGFGKIRTICDKCNGKNSIIYHYPNYDSYVDTDPPASEPATNPISSYDWVTIKNPTCEESGTEYNYSTMETRSIPALGHNYSNEYTVDKGATCTEDGLKSRHCSRCGAHTDEVVIEKRGYHDWYDGIYTKYPTCITEGEKTYYCKYCTQSKTEMIPALGHNFSNEYTVDKYPSCTQDGIKSKHCSRCNAHTDEVVIEKLGYHDWDNGRITKQPTCITEGIRTRQCKYCIQTQTEIIPALGHNFSNQYTVEKEPTCTEDGFKSRHCTRCEAHTDEVVIEKHGHHVELVGKKAATYFATGYTGDDVCTVCGTVITKGKAIAKSMLSTPKVKITAGTQKMTVKYTKVKDATGFQVSYTFNSKTVTKTYSTKKSVTKVIKKLKKGTYKVKVRALIKSKGKTAYSNWTKAKKYKVK